MLVSLALDRPCRRRAATEAVSAIKARRACDNRPTPTAVCPTKSRDATISTQTKALSPRETVSARRKELSRSFGGGPLRANPEQRNARSAYGS
jgi:hypothetical protein